MENKIFFLIQQQQITLMHQSGLQVFCFAEELQGGRIFNMTNIRAVLQNYLKIKRLQTTGGVVLFADTLLEQQIIMQQQHYANLAKQTYIKLTLDQGRSYQASLSPEMLFQYQLLFWQVGVYIERFTTELAMSLRYAIDFEQATFDEHCDFAKLKQLCQNFNLDLYPKLVQVLAKGLSC